MEGKTLAGYEIQEALGEGGMGVVYRARDVTLDRPAAVKVIRPESLDEIGRARFIREAQACSKINHPNIVTVYAAGEEDGRPYLAMELLEGRTLREVINEGPVPWAKALQWMADILDALNRLHQAGIVHRDLKPENIMFTTDGVIKLMDFGIASLISSATITREHTTVGTVLYMSPERISGDKGDARSDIFALGVILYEMLARKHPFRGAHPMAIMYSITNDVPTPIDEITKELPNGLRAVLDRALEKDPANRFPDAGSFRSVLSDLLKGTEFSTAQVLAVGRKKRLVMGVVVPGVLLIALVIVILSVVSRERSPVGDRAVAVNHNEMGQNYQSEGDIDAAQAEYRKAIAADQEYAVPWNNLAVIAFDQGNLDEADSLLHMAISMEPKYAAALFNLGSVCRGRNDLEGAEKYYRASIEADSSQAGGFNNLGDLLLERGRVEGAASVLDAGLLRNPTHPFLLKNRGRVALQQGQDEKALDYWKRALEGLPGNTELHRLLAEWYERKGMSEEAKLHWQEVAKSDDEEERERAQRALKRPVRSRQ
ncbi:MAG: protein kinase [Candidatus Latescibacteria bacterium]|nr:protein kinase [Candidatus Latescibacterota bacterium]NIM66315.1 protein kinase [Candidatus Latescibacterota bacterium]NIO02794.1 protein kinase [Candidatus Latescibacterota bacterium]NIO29929.1 protein kinase [Candidatus Latescibacterota bacterium]NIO57544.1 protein kinase [Candidatus Latescibacterota bacterium]